MQQVDELLTVYLACSGAAAPWTVLGRLMLKCFCVSEKLYKKRKETSRWQNGGVRCGYRAGWAPPKC